MLRRVHIGAANAPRQTHGGGALTGQAKADPVRHVLHERLVKGTATALWLAVKANDAAPKSWRLAADAYIGGASEFHQC